MLEYSFDSSFEVAEAEAGQRLDLFAANVLEITRNQAQRYIEQGNILVNQKAAAKRYLIKPGDFIACDIPPPEGYEVLPENIPLEVVFEDGDIIVLNKPQGMVVHPAPGHSGGTLVNALLHHCKDLSGINGILRPGIVHRLDKDTSGLIVIAKNDHAHQGLAAQLTNRTMGRIYHAIVRGVVSREAFSIENAIGRHPFNRKKMAVLPDNKGRTAITHIKVLERYHKHTLIQAKLETGRTHQIRVHMAHIGHPLLGDKVYGTAHANLSGQVLHAKSLVLTHPSTGKEMYFDSVLPDYFVESINLRV